MYLCFVCVVFLVLNITSVILQHVQPNSITISILFIARFVQLPVKQTLRHSLFFIGRNDKNCFKFVNRAVFVVFSTYSVISFQSNSTVSSFLSIRVFGIGKLIKDKCLRIAINVLAHASHALVMSGI